MNNTAITAQITITSELGTYNISLSPPVCLIPCNSDYTKPQYLDFEFLLNVMNETGIINCYIDYKKYIGLNTFSFDQTTQTLKISKLDEDISKTRFDFDFNVYLTDIYDSKITDQIQIGVIKLILIKSSASKDGYTAILSNETESISCDNLGNIKNWVNVPCETYALYGIDKNLEYTSNPIPGNGQYNISLTPTNCTVSSITNGVFNVTSFGTNGDTARVNVRFNLENKTNITKTMSLNKNYGGNPGSSPVSWEIVPNFTTLKIDNISQFYFTLNKTVGETVTLYAYKIPNELSYVQSVLYDKSNNTLADIKWGITPYEEHESFYIKLRELMEINKNNLSQVLFRVVNKQDVIINTSSISFIYDGLEGPGITNEGLWDSTKTTYLCRPDIRIVVNYKINNVNSYYMSKLVSETSGLTVDSNGCIPIPVNTIPNSANGQKYWKTFGGQFTSIATDLLFAENAYFNVAKFGKGILLGDNEDTALSITEQGIRSRKTGLNISNDGTITAPVGGIKFTSGSTVENVIDDKIDKIEIGGTNLVQNSMSDPFVDYWRFDGWSKVMPFFVGKSQYGQCGLQFEIIDGWGFFYITLDKDYEQVAVQFDHKVIAEQNSSGATESSLLATQLSTGNSFGDYSNGINIPMSWDWSSHKLVISPTGRKVGFFVRLKQEGIGLKAQFLIRNLKIESGNKHTEWTQAPTDEDGSRNYALGTSFVREIRDSEGNAENRVHQLYKIKKEATGGLTSVSAKIKFEGCTFSDRSNLSLQGGGSWDYSFGPSVYKSFNFQNGVEYELRATGPREKVSQDGTIDIRLDYIVGGVVKVYDVMYTKGSDFKKWLPAKEDSENGGRNYIRNFEHWVFDDNNANWKYTGYVLENLNITPYTAARSNLIDVIPGTGYHLSFNSLAWANESVNIQFELWNNDERVHEGIFYHYNFEGKGSIPISLPYIGGNIPHYNKVKIILFYYREQTGRGIRISHLKLEKDTLTDWSPAPEDTTDDINNGFIDRDFVGENTFKSTTNIYQLYPSGPRVNIVKHKEEHGFYLHTDQSGSGNQNSDKWQAVIRIPNVINSKDYWTFSGYLSSYWTASWNVWFDVCDHGSFVSPGYNVDGWTYFEFTVDLRFATQNIGGPDYHFIDVNISSCDGQTIRFKDFKVERGRKATKWSPALGDSYLEQAFKEETTINGGLIATTLVKVGATNNDGVWIEKAGISGLGSSAYGSEKIRFYSGVDYDTADQFVNGKISRPSNICAITENGKLYCSNADISGTINATSGSIGLWKIENSNLVCTNQSTFLEMSSSGYDFLKLQTGSQEIIQVRADNKKGISIYTQEYKGIGLQISAQTSAMAMTIAGGVSMYQRTSGGVQESWNMPGVICAGIIWSDGSLGRTWGYAIHRKVNNNYTFSSYRSAKGKYVITHNLGHTDYICMVCKNSLGGTDPYVISQSANSCEVGIVHTNSGDHVDGNLNFILVGRNTYYEELHIRK